MIRAFKSILPTVADSAYVDPAAIVIGHVTLGERVSIWPNATLRGDVNKIFIGDDSNIQDNAVLHLADDLPCLVGNWVTIGHSATVHACTVEDECLIGMGATVLDGAVIGAQSLVGAHALVTPGTQIPPGSLVVGAPAVVKRRLSESERAGLKYWAEKYVVNGAYCLKHNLNVGSPLLSPP
mgnify:CR=1 FL=1